MRNAHQRSPEFECIRLDAQRHRDAARGRGLRTIEAGRRMAHEAIMAADPQDRAWLMEGFLDSVRTLMPLSTNAASTASAFGSRANQTIIEQATARGLAEQLFSREGRE